MIDFPDHTRAFFWLEIADKVLKLAAVIIGGLWTFWNYGKSRRYEQKLELLATGTAFVKEDLYGAVSVTVKNIGATKHTVQHKGTLCQLEVVKDDLTVETIEVFRLFAHNDRIEPGESINDTHFWRIQPPFDRILWVKLSLRVVSNGVEWVSTSLIRVEGEVKNPASR